MLQSFWISGSNIGGHLSFQTQNNSSKKSISINTGYLFTEKYYSKLLTGGNMNSDAAMQKAKRSLAELEDKANSIINDLLLRVRLSYGSFRVRFTGFG